MKFCQTKSGIAICPFFGWQSENIEGLGQQEENDVNLVMCSHKDNSVPYEGNCQEKLCPLLKDSESNKNLKQKGTRNETV